MASLQGYGLSREELDKLQLTLASYVESRIRHHVQEAANTAMSRMKERYNLFLTFSSLYPSWHSGPISLSKKPCNTMTCFVCLALGRMQIILAC